MLHRRMGYPTYLCVNAFHHTWRLHSIEWHKVFSFCSFHDHVNLDELCLSGWLCECGNYIHMCCMIKFSNTNLTPIFCHTFLSVENNLVQSTHTNSNITSTTPSTNTSSVGECCRKQILAGWCVFSNLR